MYHFIVFAFLFLLTAAVQAGEGYVFLAKGTEKDTATKLFYIRDNEVYSPDKKNLLYFQKGNIFFTGSNDDRQNIFFMTTSMNIGEEKLQKIYEKDSRQPLYSFGANKFYSGKYSDAETRDKHELIHVERTGKWLAFYSSVNDSLLAYYMADSLSPSVAIITAYTLVQKYELKEEQDIVIAKGPFVQPDYSTLRPMWGNVTANEWIWDGQLLRPRWDANPQSAWVFDGQTVKPYYGNNIYEQFSWDGEIFKPTWRTNRAQEWSWDGTILKPIWDTDWANQYKIEGGVIKPWSNVHTDKEWKMEGNIPIPLIIVVVSGIARP